MNNEDVVMIAYSQVQSAVISSAQWWAVYQTENGSFLYLLSMTVNAALWSNMQCYFTSYFHIHTKLSSEAYQMLLHL